MSFPTILNKDIIENKIRLSQAGDRRLNCLIERSKQNPPLIKSVLFHLSIYSIFVLNFH